MGMDVLRDSGGPGGIVGGVVTVVTATLPVTSSGGAAPDIGLTVTPAHPGGAVALQAATPGTAQTGNSNLTGVVKAGKIIGASAADNSGFFQSTAAGNASPTVLVKQVGAGAAPLFEAQDSAATPLASIVPSGNMDAVSYSVGGAAGQSTSFVIGAVTYTFTNGILTSVV